MKNRTKEIMKTIVEKLWEVTEERNFMYHIHYPFDIKGKNAVIKSSNESFAGVVLDVYKDYSSSSRPATVVVFSNSEEIIIKNSHGYEVELSLNDAEYVEYLKMKIEVINKRISILNVVIESIKIRELNFQKRGIEKELLKLI